MYVYMSYILKLSEDRKQLLLQTTKKPFSVTRYAWVKISLKIHTYLRVRTYTYVRMYGYMYFQRKKSIANFFYS